MPSSTTIALSRLGYCQLLVIALVGIFLLLLSMYTLASFGIKAYVLHNFGFEQFKSCKLEYLFQYTQVTFFGSVFFLCIGSFVLFCMAYSSERSSEVLLSFFAMAVSEFVIMNTFMFFVGSMFVWTPLPTPEEFLMFYPEFYEIPFDGCASGGLFEAMSLAILAFRIESSLIMIGLILVVPFTLFCSIIFAEEPDLDATQIQARV